jgi:endoglucanase
MVETRRGLRVSPTSMPRMLLAGSPRLVRHLTVSALLTLSLCGACGREAIPSATNVVHTPNLISNGDFSQGLAPWGAHAAGDDQGRTAAPPPEPRLIDGALCTTVHGGQEVIVGWPVSGSSESFALTAGKSYALFLRISASGPLPVQCVIKVGHQIAPYTAAFTTRLPSNATLQRFAVTFAPDHDDDRAGVALECRAEAGTSVADVCIDDVSLGS